MSSRGDEGRVTVVSSKQKISSVPIMIKAEVNDYLSKDVMLVPLAGNRQRRLKVKCAGHDHTLKGEGESLERRSNKSPGGQLTGTP